MTQNRHDISKDESIFKYGTHITANQDEHLELPEESITLKDALWIVCLIFLVVALVLVLYGGK